MKKRYSRGRLAAVGILLCLSLAGCGGDDGGSNDSGSSGTGGQAPGGTPSALHCAP